MRKLKLQMFMSLDGFVAPSAGETPDEVPTPETEPTSAGDEKVDQYLYSTIETSDTILLGRKTVNDFVTYWESVVNNYTGNPQYPLAKQLVDTPKVVFTKTLKESSWNNTTLATGDLVEEVNRIKNQPGRDIIVYGGGGFVSSLIKEDLIDEYHLFINPNILGQGMPIFNKLTKQLDLSLRSATAFSTGVVLHLYERKRD
jgi:dihydrofolate reductase